MARSGGDTDVRVVGGLGRLHRGELALVALERAAVLRRDVIRSGEFYIVPTKVNGIGALRCTIINPLTEETHLDQLMDTLRKQGQALLNRQQ